MKFDQLQFDQIHRGYIQGLDFTIYASHNYSWQQMHQIRLGLIRKLDVSQYLDENIMSLEMAKIRKRLEKEKKRR